MVKTSNTEDNKGENKDLNVSDNNKKKKDSKSKEAKSVSKKNTSKKSANNQSEDKKKDSSKKTTTTNKSTTKPTANTQATKAEKLEELQQSESKGINMEHSEDNKDNLEVKETDKVEELKSESQADKTQADNTQEEKKPVEKGNPTPFDFTDPSIENNVPKYLSDTYSWAYVDDKAIKFWDTPFKVNFILWGNAKRLTQALYDKLETRKPQKMLQVTSVYGNVMPDTAKRLHKETTLDVIDIVTGQLKSAKRKLDPIMGDRVSYYLADSSDLPFEDEKYDQVYVFMLLHEQPIEVRNKTLNEAFRVLKPGGDLIVVDYHKPFLLHPLLPIMWVIYKTLEPFAMNLWGMEIPDILGLDAPIYSAKKETYFGSLFQRWVITKSEDGKAHWHSKNPLPKSDK